MRTMVELVPLGGDLELGVVPRNMHAVVIRRGREGDPRAAMRHEVVAVPPLGPRDVLVRVMAAGVNFNGIWAARGEPVSVMNLTKDDFHIAGSDASGVVWKVGAAVTRWKPGDEVVLHCNQSCGDCADCNGFDPLACSEQRIWGYETNYGSFAQFTRAQSQQLLPKPKKLDWVTSGSYMLCLATAYRMLLDRAALRAGEIVLVWGASGGLGVFALQICRLVGATAIAIVSSDERGEHALANGAHGYVNRRDYEIAMRPTETPAEERHRVAETRRMGRAIRELTGGRDADVVLEHVGGPTFAASCLLAARFGRVVICGATAGHMLTFDVRHVWMRQKSIIGSHFANAHEAHRANELVRLGRVVPRVHRVFSLEETAEAHALMADNGHVGKLVVRVDAPS